MSLQTLRKKTKSSTKAREFQRYQGMAAITNGADSSFTAANVIPIGAQMLLSGYACCHDALKPRERLMCGFQSFLTFSQLALMCAIYFKSDNCKEQQLALCKALLLAKYLYQGTLLINWFIAELNKEAHPETHPHKRKHHRDIAVTAAIKIAEIRPDEAITPKTTQGPRFFESYEESKESEEVNHPSDICDAV